MSETTEITNADQLTGTEFKRMVRQPKTWLLIIGGTLLVGAIFGFMSAPSDGAIAALVAFVLGIGITYGMADTKSEEAFYDAYAKSRGLERSDADLPETTPLLRKGDERETKVMFTGRLGGDFEGSLALYTYTEKSVDSDGDQSETDYPFTVVVLSLPETSEHISELIVEEQAGFRSLEKLEDAFRGDLERLKLESEALDDRFEIFVREDQDPVWVRQLFSPSFIVWLTEHRTKRIAFDLVDGNLCVYLPEHRETADGLDEMVAVSCEIGDKLRKEALE